MADESKVSLARVLQEAVKEFIERHPQSRLQLFAQAHEETP
jgi:signal transduction histidine kinase